MPPEILLETEPVTLDELKLDHQDRTEQGLKRLKAVTKDKNVAVFCDMILKSRLAASVKHSNMSTVKPGKNTQPKATTPSPSFDTVRTAVERDFDKDGNYISPQHRIKNTLGLSDRLWGIIHNRHDDEGNYLEPKDRPPRSSSSLQSWKDRVRSPPRSPEEVRPLSRKERIKARIRRAINIAAYGTAKGRNQLP